MSNLVWDKISHFYCTKTSNKYPNYNQNITARLKSRKILNIFSYSKQQNFKKDKKVDFFITSFFQKNFRKIFSRKILNNYTSFSYSLKDRFFLKTSTIYRNVSRKYFNFNWDYYPFFTSEILILWDFNTKLFSMDFFANISSDFP